MHAALNAARTTALWVCLVPCSPRFVVVLLFGCQVNVCVNVLYFCARYYYLHGLLAFNDMRIL